MAGLDLSGLTAEVEEQETVVASATTLLDKLFAEFQANKNNPTAIQALVDRGKAATAKLAASIAANTAAADEVPAAGNSAPTP